MRESDIQKLILDYLAAEHILAFRMNTGAMSGAYKGKRWYVRFGERGQADILCFYPCHSGLFMPVWLEIKTDVGKQSQWQKSFQADVERRGMRYYIVRNWRDIELIFKSLQELRQVRSIATLGR
jgi:hypothetical protein